MIKEFLFQTGGSSFNGPGSENQFSSPTQPRDHRTVLYQESDSVFDNAELRTEQSNGGKSNYINAFGKSANQAAGKSASEAVDKFANETAAAAAGGPAVSLPQIESGSHSFIRSLNTACLQGPAQLRVGPAVRPPAVRRDVIDEDYD